MRLLKNKERKNKLRVVVHQTIDQDLKSIVPD